MKTLGKKQRYKVTELDGSPIEGTFYADELQRIQPPMVYDIECIVRRRKNKQTGIKELCQVERVRRQVQLVDT